MDQINAIEGALEAEVLPVVGATYTAKNSTLHQLSGSAFLISPCGLSLTAYHVILNGQRICEEKGWTLSLVGKGDNGRTNESVAAPITFAAEGDVNSDTCVIRTDYKASTQHIISRRKPTIWQRVATVGYPEEAVHGEVGEIWLPLRGQKGIVQRVIPTGLISHLPNAKAYELSFATTGGMSGAPLFTYPGEGVQVVAIVTGTYESEYQISEMRDVAQDGTEYRETRLSLNRYGIAVSIEHVLNVRLPIVDRDPTLVEYLQSIGRLSD